MNSVEEVKQRIDIVSMISEDIQLGKAGRNFRGLCPFHTEKTPSFFVFPERQSWHCYGCGAGGDIISFVMKKESLSFGEALNKLASKAGVSLPEKKARVPENQTDQKLYRINEAAAQYFHELLLNSPAAEKARKYIAGRQISADTLAQFRLGYSLDSWDRLKLHLKEKGYREADAIAAGLAIPKDDRSYDRFRGRLMFPICNAKGQVLGFGARALDDSMPKYLNSSESSIFSKSSVLYGIDHATGAIRKQGKVVIVEGYMDTLTAHQNGFQNVVASMGTALTEKQITILRHLTNHICFSLDADAAGNAATLRGIEVCRKTLAEEVTGTKTWLGGSTQLDTDITIISMPEGKDPDDVIRENPEEWQQLVNGAQPLLDYLFNITARDFDLSRPEGQSQLSNELLPLIAGMQDSAVREAYLTKLSKLTGLSDDILKRKAADYFRTTPIKRKNNKSKELGPSSSTRRTGDQLEEYFLFLLIKYPSLRNTIGSLTIEHLECSENREIFAALKDDHHTIDETRQNLEESLWVHFDSLAGKQLPPFDKMKQKKALNDCIRFLEIRRLRYQYVFEAESVLDDGANPDDGSARLTEIKRQHTTLG